jgi:polyhydroxyalkanoate synthesis regulator phasin
MDSQQTIEFLKKGLHVTLGATTSLVESVQDPFKREENLAQLNLGFDELTHIWEEKGAVTESEARQFIDTVISSSVGTTTSDSGYSASQTTGVSDNFDSAVANDIKDLTQHLSEMREELSKPQDISFD